MTQELIHPASPATMSRSSAPSIQAPSPIARIETNWGRVSVKAKHCRWPVQSSRSREVPRRHCATATPASHRWGLVLAGADGVGLREPSQNVWGADRPKQSCPLFESRTLLEVTRRRVERSVSPEQILYSVRQGHEHYYLPSLADRPSQRIVQPSEKGTAPAILSALIQIVQRDPNAVVVILPCDHPHSPESAFTTALESAFEIAERRSRFVVLLGVEPKSPSWIEVVKTTSSHSGFAMVGHVCTLLELAWAAVPSLLQLLESPEIASSASGEIRIPRAIYDRIDSIDFSRQVLSAATDRLLALRLANVEWSDVGDRNPALVKLLEQNASLPGLA